MTKRLLLLMAVVYSLTVALFWATSIRTVMIYPAMDSYSWESVPNANNGGSDNFAITSSISGPKNMRGWLAFDIQGIPRDVWVLSAKLQLRVWHKTTAIEGGDTTGRTYAVYRVTQPWTEFNVTWANQPNYTEEHHATSPVPNGQGGWDRPLLYMDWDLTATVKDWLSGANNYGVMIRDTQENGAVQYTTQFFTHNKTPDPSYYPRLFVTYLVPQLLAIFVVGLTAETLFIYAFWRRSRHQSAM